MRRLRSPPRYGTSAPANVDAFWAVAPVAAFHCDPQGHCLAVNPKWCELAGICADDAFGGGWLRSIHPDDRDRVIADWTRNATGDCDFDVDVRFLRADGSVVRAHGPVTALRDEHGELTCFLGVLADVTDRHEAEQVRTEHENGLRASEAMYRTLAVAVPIGIAHRNQRGDLTFMNPAFRAIIGVSDHHPPGEINFDIVHGDDRDRLTAAMRGALETGVPYEEKARLLRPDGEVRWISARGTRHMNDDGTFGGYLVTAVDVTEQRAAERARRRADEQFQVAFDEAPIGIGIIAMDGKFTRVNQAFTAIVGYGADEMCELAPYALVSPADKSEARSRLLELLDSSDRTASMEFRLVHQTGNEIWAEARINLLRDDDGVPSQFLMQVQDVSDRKTYEQRLRHLAHHDPLTGLANRRGLERELDLQIARVRRYAGAGALLMLDLDNFKSVNDRLGHSVGDALLVGVAGALVERLRDTDVVARLGGDEFAVILPAESPAQSRIVATALLASIAVACEPFDAGVPVTASVGIVCFDDRVAAEEALIRADQAMYAAKQSGRNRHAMYDASSSPLLGTGSVR